MKYRIIPSLLVVSAATAMVNQSFGADYQSTVLSHNPKAYYRLNDDTGRSPIQKNSGTLGVAFNATNDLDGVVHSFSGALVGSADRAAFYDTTTRTEIPFSPVLNPPNTQPFTIEAWFYPSSDQTAAGMSPLANRWTLGGGRQGWVFFQRRPDASYLGGEPVGWNCRMYNGVDGNGKLDVTSLVPYQVGKWQHVVVVYDPVQITNATLTMYIDGVAANTNIWAGGGSGSEPGYMPVTGNLNPQPMMALGNYNNANGSLNPYFGGVDEFAVYASKLTPAQILSHYQNATNANRAQSYESLIKSHNPAAYLRLNDIAPGPNYAVNMGDTRSAGLATHTSEVRYPATSALAGRTQDGAAAHHRRNGSSTTTMPFLDANNPNAGTPFTFEAWLRPMMDAQGGQCPVNNRWVGGTGRTGWVIFQRNPNHSYPTSEGFGWNFRMYDGASGTGRDVVTGGTAPLSPGDPNYTVGDYKIGQWQHLVVTWEPQIDNGDPLGNGNNQWQGILTAYVDGVAVASNTAALYSANRATTETGSAASDLAIGSYNAASGLGSNPYEGDVDEVAIYTGFILTPDQIMAHYLAGTNANYGTNYETLVMTDGLMVQPVPGQERNGLPKTYLRFNDTARAPATNSGTLGFVADGNQIITTNIAAGPRSPAFAGFEASNTALPLDGVKEWASFNNPSGLNISGQITLEAWVRPSATQANDPSYILSHGPQTQSSFLGLGYDNAVTNTSSVFIRLDGLNPYFYTIGASTNQDSVGTQFSYVTAPAPAGDFDGNTWVHLAGTYDGTKWNLYRNGSFVASSAPSFGALPVDLGDWAVGSIGNGWANNFGGVVDEVAIYNTALTATQIASHYSAACPLTITRSAGNVTVNWCSGTLQAAGTVTGTYTNVTTANPPAYTQPASGTTFFRVKY